MSKLPKLIISLLILIISLVLYFSPEQEISIPYSGENILNKTSESSFLIGEESETVDSFGSIATIMKNTDGYGYITDAANKAESFGSISFNNSNTDSLFIKRVEAYFPDKNLRYFSNSGISYALINNEQLYIENINKTEVSGFNGPINLALVLNVNAMLDSVIYISSEETQSYLNKIFRTNYFSQFSNKTLDEEHILDAVSGATITSVAVSKAVNEIYHLSNAKSIISDNIVGYTLGFSTLAKLNKIWILNLIILVFIFTVLSFKKFRKKKILFPISIFTVLWLGFYLNSSFTYLLFIKVFTGASMSIFTTVYILLVLASTIWNKNTYCKYICPFGNAQKLMFKFSPFKNKLVVIKNKYLKLFRYFISVIIITGYLSGLEILSEFELFPYFFSINTSFIVFGISVLVMLISMRIPNLWCRALCPTGCVLDTVSDISNIKINLNKSVKSHNVNSIVNSI